MLDPAKGAGLEHALRTAEEVYVIGYSFPPTDAHVTKMTRSRDRGYDGVQVRIVSKEADPNEMGRFVQRVREAFPEAEVGIDSNEGFGEWVRDRERKS